MKKQFPGFRLFRFILVLTLPAIVAACNNPSKKTEEKTQQDTTGTGLDSLIVEFDNQFNLQPRYPRLFKDASFKKWLLTNEISNWHETSLTNDNKRNVIIQSKSTKSIYAFAITDPVTNDITIHDFANFTIDSWFPDDTASFTAIVKNKDAANLRAIRPLVIFETKELMWEAEFSNADSIAIYDIDVNTKSILQQRTISNKSESAASPSSPGADETASNELHHLANFKAEAENWTRGITTISQKCHKIFEQVNRTYSYDGNIKNISQFTWSDLLVRDENGRRGICDEFAVVQTSYLRALGIPAVIKFLIWEDGSGKSVGHAIVEYKDGDNWYHMDALWRTFNDKEKYRREGGASHVTVMDAVDPSDSKSTTPAWGVPDPTGDQRLYPYGDYVISPGYPGNERYGYSY